MAIDPIVTDAGWSCTFTSGSDVVPVTGVLVSASGIEVGDYIIDPNGMPIAVIDTDATNVYLLRNASAASAGTTQFAWQPGPHRSLVAQATNKTRDVYARMSLWADRGLGIPVIAQQNAPPGSPLDGDRYLVGTAGSGAWATHSNQFAEWSDVAPAGWLFTSPEDGWMATITGSSTVLVWTGSAWDEVGQGDVIGPASATDNAIARFDGTTGKAIQNSGATIDDSGNLLLGYGASVPIGPTSATHPQVQVHGGSGGVFSSVYRWSADTGGPGFDMVKSRGASIGARGVVQSGDVLGLMSWRGDDGTNFPGAALIRVVVDGTPGAGDMPGRIEFGTTADGASASTIRWQLMSTGHLLPYADNTYTLGSSSLRLSAFSSVLGYLSTGIRVGAGSTIGAAFDGGVHTVSQTSAVFSARGVPNAFEWGHQNGAGYACTFGFQSSSGRPYIVFNGEAGSSTINTIRTRGVLARGLIGDNAGGLSFFTVANANADNQTVVEDVKISALGYLGLAGASSPSSPIQVATSGSRANPGSGYLAVTYGQGNSYWGLFANTNFNSGVHFGDPADDDVGKIEYVHNGDRMEFHTNGAERMRIDSSGNVGLGTTLPNGLALSRAFTIADATAGNSVGLELQTAATNRGALWASNAYLVLSSYGAIPVVVKYNNADRIIAGANSVDFAVPAKPPSYTVGTVPSAATAGAGSQIYVSNETGGAVIAFSDGTNWRRVTDRAIIA